MPHRHSCIAFLATALLIVTTRDLHAVQAQSAEQAQRMAILDSVERFLAERYANFPDRVASRRIDLPALHARSDSAFRHARSDADVRKAIESLIAAFGDGHLRLVPATRSRETRSATRSEPGIAVQTSAESACRSWGYGTARSRSAFAGVEGYASLPRLGAPFERGIVQRPDGRIAILRIDTFGLEPHAWACTRAWSDWQRRATATHCDEACAERLRAEIAEIIAIGLREVVAQLAAIGAGTLVIDLTGNGGGTEWVSRAVRAVSVHPIPPTRVAEVRPQPDCDPMRAWRTAGVAPCDVRVPRGLDASDARFSAVGPWAQRIVVVIDRNTASAAEQFAANLVDHAGAAAVGARSYGSGCGYTSRNRPLRLADLELELLAPDCSRFRPDGSNEVDGIAPTLDVGWQPDDNARRRAERVIERLLRI